MAKEWIEGGGWGGSVKDGGEARVVALGLEGGLQGSIGVSAGAVNRVIFHTFFLRGLMTVSRLTKRSFISSLFPSQRKSLISSYLKFAILFGILKMDKNVSRHRVEHQLLQNHSAISR